MLSDDDESKLSEAIFMVAFETSLRNLRMRGIKSDNIFTGMIRSMTNVIRMLFKEMDKD